MWPAKSDDSSNPADHLVHKIRLNAEIASMRRTEFRPPVIRPWGVASGVRPRPVRRLPPGVMAVGWLGLLLAAIAIVALIGR